MCKAKDKVGPNEPHKRNKVRAEKTKATRTYVGLDIQLFIYASSPPALARAKGDMLFLVGETTDPRLTKIKGRDGWICSLKWESSREKRNQQKKKTCWFPRLWDT